MMTPGKGMIFVAESWPGNDPHNPSLERVMEAVWVLAAVWLALAIISTLPTRILDSCRVVCVPSSQLGLNQ